MKRKVIQHGPSTLVISIPSAWVKKYNINKGDELNIDDIGKKIIIKTENKEESQIKEISYEDYPNMISRVIHAYYKNGTDQIVIKFKDQKSISEIQKSLNKETVGYEIIEQKRNHCIIRQIAPALGDYKTLLRRTFLSLISFSEEISESIKSDDIGRLKDALILEETNNRLTTMIRRNINKSETEEKMTGPLYYIVEDLENLCDEFKYMLLYLIEKKNTACSKEVMEIYDNVTVLLKEYYKLYYKFDERYVVNISEKRKSLIKKSIMMLEKEENANNKIMLHHCITITQKIFCMVGPYLVSNI